MSAIHLHSVGEIRLQQGYTLVTPEQCAGKYITYTRSLAVYVICRYGTYARRQAVARRFASAKIMRTNMHKCTDRYTGTIIVENSGCLVAPTSYEINIYV